MDIIPFSQFTKVHQTATIIAGGEGRVFYFKIPQSTVGFMQKLANNWFTGITLKLIIDGEVIDNSIQRIVALLEEPEKYEPPYLVRNSIEVRASNTDTSSHAIDVLVDGILVQKKVIK